MKNEKVILKGLHPSDYEHPFDRKALETLEGTPGLDRLTRKFWEVGLDRLMKVQHAGSNILVSHRNFPELENAYSCACETLYFDRRPDLYLMWEYGINAHATGVKQPLVAVCSGCIDLLDSQELTYILGHELGHIKSNHILYHQMANVLPFFSQLAGQATFGIGFLLGQGLQLALYNWQRMSEFTSDRAGLLACQDRDAALRVLVKMAGLPIKHFNSGIEQEFLKQAREFQDYDYDKLNKLVKMYSVMNRTHPWTVMRAAELLRWVESGEYDAVLMRCSQVKTEVPADICSNCEAHRRESHKFCGSCGASLAGNELTSDQQT